MWSDAPSKQLTPRILGATAGGEFRMVQAASSIFTNRTSGNSGYSVTSSRLLQNCDGQLNK